MSIPQSGGGPIEDRAQLVEYLSSGCKPKDAWRIGTEHEKFGYCKDTHRPLPYAGERSVEAVLSGLRDRYGWAPVEEAGKLIGLIMTGPMSAWNRAASWSFQARRWKPFTRPVTR